MLKAKAKINVLQKGKVIAKTIVNCEVSKVYVYKGIYLFTGKHVTENSETMSLKFMEFTTGLSFNSKDINEVEDHFNMFGVDKIKQLIVENEKLNLIDTIGNKKVIDIEYELSIADSKRDLIIAKRLFNSLKKSYGKGLILHEIPNSGEYRSMNKGVNWNISFKVDYLKSLIEVMNKCKVGIPVTID